MKVLGSVFLQISSLACGFGVFAYLFNRVDQVSEDSKSNLTQINWNSLKVLDYFQYPLEGYISTFTKIFSARKAQKIFSKVLKLSVILFN